MSTFLANCIIATARAQVSAGGGISAPAPFLRQVHGHISFFSASLTGYRLLPEAALSSEFVFNVGMNAQLLLPDIRYGDLVTSITELDGKTPWPGANVNESYHVIYTRRPTPLFLDSLYVYIARITGGGKLY